MRQADTTPGNEPRNGRSNLGGPRGAGGVLLSRRLPILWFLIHTTMWILGARLLPGDALVPYRDLGAVGTPWIRQFILPLLVVTTIQVAFLWRCGCRREIFEDRERSSRRLSWLAPAGIIVLCLLVTTRGFVVAPAHHYTGLVVTCALVGVTEELTFRGVIVAALRRSGAGERRTAVISSVLFGLFHLPNIVLGAAVAATLRQVVFTTVMGLVFYAVRRATGRLLPGMLLHGIYDAVLLASVT